MARFLRQAQITAQLDHPAIVPVNDLGLDARGSISRPTDDELAGVEGILRSLP